MGCSNSKISFFNVYDCRYSEIVPKLDFIIDVARKHQEFSFTRMKPSEIDEFFDDYIHDLMVDKLVHLFKEQNELVASEYRNLILFCLFFLLYHQINEIMGIEFDIKILLKDWIDEFSSSPLILLFYALDYNNNGFFVLHPDNNDEVGKKHKEIVKLISKILSAFKINEKKFKFLENILNSLFESQHSDLIFTFDEFRAYISYCVENDVV
eukprot:TRINITY_DN2883_c0_g2_i1.p1 TRINITY_DN2883_c0_g2~~TRINITY_DN2883_c0_g2_i1.p1  ORF type:complete len:210 (-),score=39.03 TRINITY_DN2883_c0_g2_i1:190-819(-)